jgi:C4-dicarboxylate-specific signal transduction histidine kinase
LERRVFERTLEISTVNAELIAEIGVRTRAEAELLTLKEFFSQVRRAQSTGTGRHDTSPQI